MTKEESKLKALAYPALIEDGKILISTSMECTPGELCRLEFL